MIQKFIKRFFKNEEVIKSKLAAASYLNYEDIVKIVVEAIEKDDYDEPKAYTLQEVTFGSYQGVNYYFFGDDSGNNIWYVSLDYGSCSVCDTLCSILDMQNKQERDADLFTFALHIVQSIKEFY